MGLASAVERSRAPPDARLGGENGARDGARTRTIVRFGATLPHMIRARYACLSLFAVAACGDDSGAVDTEADSEAITSTVGESGTGTGLPAPDDGLPLAPEAGEWIAVEPAGDTVCSRGTPYAFFVRGGRPDRVIIDFQGGGACWDELSCSVADSLFRDAVPELSEFTGALESGVFGGIFDASEGTPFADWTIVHIPYCTGDIHWGNATQNYGEDLTIEHKGFVNATAALDWTYARFEPETILVSGCSAGAYGAVLHSAYVADHYPEAKISMLADSGAGIITQSFLQDSLPNWGAEPNLPPFIESVQVPITELQLTDLYLGIARFFPEHRFAQTSTAYDNDQIFYYSAMGGEVVDWPGLFRESIATLEAELPNFRAYVPGGPVHCVTPYPFFAEREVDGVRISDWVSELAQGEETPDSVACEGTSCCEDPVCAACADGSAAPWCQFCAGWPDQWAECAP
jgi:hypothetical protein